MTPSPALLRMSLLVKVSLCESPSMTTPYAVVADRVQVDCVVAGVGEPEADPVGRDRIVRDLRVVNQQQVHADVALVFVTVFPDTVRFFMVGVE